MLCSLVLTVSRGKREMSTAMPAMPPDTREVRKLGSLILSLATRDTQDGVSISEMRMILRLVIASLVLLQDGFI